MGELDEALRIRTEEQLPVYERLGDVCAILVCQANTALIYLQQNLPGDREKALALLHVAWQAAEQLKIPEAEQIATLLQHYENPGD